MARRRARELAFRTLFQSERGAEELLDVWAGVRAELAEVEDEPDDETYGDPLDRNAIQFADALLRAYDADREHIDGVLEQNISGWSFSQMSQTDLNVLRLAVTEMYHIDTPAEVAIEMAIRVAKKFGGDESGRFVNGVLAKVFRGLKQERRAAEREGEGQGERADADDLAVGREAGDAGRADEGGDDAAEIGGGDEAGAAGGDTAPDRGGVEGVR